MGEQLERDRAAVLRVWPGASAVFGVYDDGRRWQIVESPRGKSAPLSVWAYTEAAAWADAARRLTQTGGGS